MGPPGPQQLQRERVRAVEAGTAPGAVRGSELVAREYGVDVHSVLASRWKLQRRVLLAEPVDDWVVLHQRGELDELLLEDQSVGHALHWCAIENRFPRRHPNHRQPKRRAAVADCILTRVPCEICRWPLRSIGEKLWRHLPPCVVWIEDANAEPVQGLINDLETQWAYLAAEWSDVVWPGALTASTIASTKSTRACKSTRNPRF